MGTVDLLLVNVVLWLHRCSSSTIPPSLSRQEEEEKEKEEEEEENERKQKINPVGSLVVVLVLLASCSDPLVWTSEERPVRLRIPSNSGPKSIHLSFSSLAFFTRLLLSLFPPFPKVFKKKGELVCIRLPCCVSARRAKFHLFFSFLPPSLLTEIECRNKRKRRTWLFFVLFCFALSLSLSSRRLLVVFVVVVVVVDDSKVSANKF